MLPRPNELEFLGSCIGVTIFGALFPEHRLQVCEPRLNAFPNCLVNGGKEVSDRNPKDGFVAESDRE